MSSTTLAGVCRPARVLIQFLFVFFFNSFILISADQDFAVEVSSHIFYCHFREGKFINQREFSYFIFVHPSFSKQNLERHQIDRKERVAAIVLLSSAEKPLASLPHFALGFHPCASQELTGSNFGMHFELAV